MTVKITGTTDEITKLLRGSEQAEPIEIRIGSSKINFFDDEESEDENYD